MNDVILYSGGVDSFLVHHALNRDNIQHSLLYFDLGGKYSENEVSLFQSNEFKHYIGQEVKISKCLNMGVLEHDDAYIPNRNIVATIMAHSVCGYDNIWIGGTLSDRVNDNNSEVFLRISDLLSHVHGKKITITSPFWNDHKCQLVKDFVDTNGWTQYESRITAQQALINSTFSCYYPNETKIVTACIDDTKYHAYYTKECLNCPACFRKVMSLFSGGIFIPMKFEALPLISKYTKEAVDYINSDNDGIMKPRMEATIQYEESFRNLIMDEKV